MGKVGYGRPPAHSQFKKGKSGNPRGRPKNSVPRQALKDMFKDCLFEEIEVVKNGKRRKVPALQAVFINLRTQALKGEPRAIRLILEIADEHVPHNLSITDLMAGRKPLEWTAEDEKRYSKASLLEGVPYVGGPPVKK